MPLTGGMEQSKMQKIVRLEMEKTQQEETKVRLRRHKTTLPAPHPAHPSSHRYNDTHGGPLLSFHYFSIKSNKRDLKLGSTQTVGKEEQPLAAGLRTKEEEGGVISSESRKEVKTGCHSSKDRRRKSFSTGEKKERKKREMVNGVKKQNKMKGLNQVKTPEASLITVGDHKKEATSSWSYVKKQETKVTVKSHSNHYQRKMASRAAVMMVHCVFEGSLLMSEVDKERRPYLKNCSCALHTPKDETPRTCFHHTRISYAKKPSWNINCTFSKTDASNPIQSSSRRDIHS
ncbi:hypothetical protein LXL04_018171 [Taraxacum kok-saghyz]